MIRTRYSSIDVIWSAGPFGLESNTERESAERESRACVNESHIADEIWKFFNILKSSFHTVSISSPSYFYIVFLIAFLEKDFIRNINYNT